MRNPTNRTFTAVLVLTLTVALSLPVVAGEPDGPRTTSTLHKPGFDDMVLDVVVQRPVGIGAMVTGTLLFIVSLPFSVPSDSVGSAFDEMVREPTAYTFRRCLGCIPDYSD